MLFSAWRFGLPTQPGPSRAAPHGRYWRGGGDKPVYPARRPNTPLDSGEPRPFFRWDALSCAVRGILSSACKNRWIVGAGRADPAEIRLIYHSQRLWRRGGGGGRHTRGRGGRGGRHKQRYTSLHALTGLKTSLFSPRERRRCNDATQLPILPTPRAALPPMPPPAPPPPLASSSSSPSLPQGLHTLASLREVRYLHF